MKESQDKISKLSGLALRSLKDYRILGILWNTFTNLCQIGGLAGGNPAYRCSTKSMT